MTTPLIDPSDLGAYLNDDSIQEVRATLMIQLAQAACEYVVNPIPAGKLYVLYRVAARAYMTGGARRGQYVEDDAYGDAPASPGAVDLTAKDRADLLDEGPSEFGVDAFTMHTLPRTVCVPDAYVPLGRWPVWGGW